MAYQEDLTLHTYMPSPYGPVLSVGWLEGTYPYSKGAVPLPFLQKLITLMSLEGNIIHWTRGFHECDLKDISLDAKEWYKEVDVQDFVDNGEIHIFYQNRFYASPAMIVEYIYRFGYKPPQEYIDAVLNGEVVSDTKLYEFEQKAKLDIDADKIEIVRKKIQECESYLKQQRLKEAKNLIENALSLVPNYTPAIFYKARIAMEEKNYEEAIEIIEENHILFGNKPAIYALKGNIYYYLKDWENAKRLLKMVLPSLRLSKNTHNMV